MDKSKHIISCIISIVLATVILGQRSDIVPAKISPVTISNDGGDTCPSQSQIDLQLETAKLETQNLISSNSEVCGGLGWRKIVDINMTNPSEVCPSSLTLVTSPVRGCGRTQTGSNICESIMRSYPTNDYTKVCGRVLAYQRGRTYAFAGSSSNIDRNYADGVSITRGPSGSRQHIWTFVAAQSETSSSYLPGWNCECTNNQYNWTNQVPSFMGNDYFCDTGNPGPSTVSSTYYSDDPLWDGQGCGPHSSCCQLHNPPWFYKELPQATRDNIEIRLCIHGFSSHADVIVQVVEIYVK